MGYGGLKWEHSIVRTLLKINKNKGL